MSNVRKLEKLIKEDNELQKVANEYNQILFKEVETFFPTYLNKQIGFIVGSFTNISRSLIVDYAYNQKLLSLDEEHNHFVYNMVVIKEKE